MKKLNLIYVLLIAFCFQACKSNQVSKNSIAKNDNGEWNVYDGSYDIEGSSDCLLFLKINESDNTFELHWLTSFSGEQGSMVSRLSFEDEYVHQDEFYKLPANNITFNEFKMNTGKSNKLPLDQDPNFQYNKSTKVLVLLDRNLDLLTTTSQEKLDDILNQFEKSEGESINLTIE